MTQILLRFYIYNEMRFDKHFHFMICNKSFILLKGYGICILLYLQQNSCLFCKLNINYMLFINGGLAFNSLELAFSSAYRSSEIACLILQPRCPSGILLDSFSKATLLAYHTSTEYVNLLLLL